MTRSFWNSNLTSVFSVPSVVKVKPYRYESGTLLLIQDPTIFLQI